jgi:hypothetical protein
MSKTTPGGASKSAGFMLASLGHVSGFQTPAPFGPRLPNAEAVTTSVQIEAYQTTGSFDTHVTSCVGSKSRASMFHRALPPPKNPRRMRGKGAPGTLGITTLQPAA